MTSVDFSGLFLTLLVYYAVVFVICAATMFCFVYFAARRILPSMGLPTVRSRAALLGISLVVALPFGFAAKEYKQHRNALYTERGEEEFRQEKEAFARRQMNEYRVVGLELSGGTPRALELAFTVPEDGLYDLHVYADLPPREQLRILPLIPEVSTDGISEDGEGSLRRQWGGENYEPLENSYDAGGIHGEYLLAENRYDMKLRAGKNTVYFLIPEALPDKSLDGLDLYVDIGPDLQGEKEILYNTTEGFMVTNPGAPVLYEGATYHSPGFENGCPGKRSPRYAQANCAAMDILDFDPAQS